MLAAGGLQAAAAAADWRAPDAGWRLRLSGAAADAHLLTVDLPLTCRGRGVSAWTLDGSELMASPILDAERLVGVECLVTAGVGSEADRPSLELYLSPDDRSPRPCAAEQRLPVRVTHRLMPLVTRPLTMPEMARLTALMPAPRTAADIASFGGDGPWRRWPRPQARHYGIWHFSCRVRRAETETLRAGPGPAPWFLFVDGRPHSDWRGEHRSRPDGGAAVGPGLARVDLFAIQGPREQIPVLLRGSGPNGAGEEFAGADLFSGRGPASVLIDEAGSDREIGVRVHGLQRYIVAANGTEILSFLATALGRTLAAATGGARLRIGAGPDLLLGERPYAATTRMLPELTLTGAGEEAQSLTLPARPVWCVPTLIDPYLSLAEFPVLTAAAGSLRFAVGTMVAPALTEALAGQVYLSWRQRTGTGTTVSRGRKPLVSASSVQECSLPLAADAAVLDLTLSCMEQPLVEPVTVRLLRPGHDLRGLQARGRRLFAGADPAVLLTGPLARLAALPRTGVAAKPASRICFADDFVAVGSGPGADLLPEEWFREHADLDVTRVSVAAGLAPGAARELWKFSTLPQVLESGAGTVVWCVGARELQAGVKPGRLCRHLLFLAQATHALGAEPVLVTLPPVAGVAADTVRAAALLTKELGLRLGVAVIDLYSRTRNTGLGNAASTAAFPAAAGNRRREWLYRALAAGLSRNRVLSGALPDVP